jgi:FlaA1/EpsC-like NDP-sugar epimerase
MRDLFEGMRVLITGGTGSLGTAVTRRLLNQHEPKQIIIFSRDELKQADMRMAFNDKRLYFIPGDIRDFHRLAYAVSMADIIINAAALKRVEVCEINVEEACATNIWGAINLVQAIREMRLPVQSVVGIGSDKGAKPLNVYGMSKALQEARLLVANLECPWCRFVGVRYGNVMGSRGSVVPIWLDKLSKGQQIAVTDPEMTRFLISLDQAVDTILNVLEFGEPDTIYIPQIPAAKLGDMAKAISGNDNFKIIGKGAGEKMHETLITEEEAERTTVDGNYYVITKQPQKERALVGEYISNEHLVSQSEIESLFTKYGFLKEKVAA